MLGEGIYLLYFAIMIGARALGLYEGQTLYNLMLVLGMLLFVCKLAVDRMPIREYAIVAVFLAAAVIVYLNSGEKGLLVCFTMMLGMRGVSTGKVISTGALVAGIIIVAKIFLGVFGFTSEIYYPQERDGVGLMFRHALGYAHPNTLHMNVLMLGMMVVYLATVKLVDEEKGEKKNQLLALVLLSIIVLAFNVYIFQYSGSRTGVLASAVYLTVNLWLFIREKLGAFEKICLYAAFPLVCFVSLILPFLLEGKLFDFVNRTIFTTRFSIARYFWENNKLSLFGQRLNNPVEQYRTYGLDMAQLYLLLQLGLIAFVVIAALTIWFIHRSILTDRRAELAVLMGMLFLGMWEPLLYNLGFKNFVYVFMGEALYEALGDGQSVREAKEPGIMVTADMLKRVLSCISAGIVVGIAASLIYLAATVTPTALYGDREQGENGKSLGMEAEYITEDEILEIEASGDIVIGYAGSSTPMYRYGSEIAEMEYDKKTLSVGVWSGIFAAALMFFGSKVWYTVFNHE